MAHALEILFRDAADTVGRLRSDARHLRELGQRAKVAVQIGHARFRARLDETLERVADGVLDIERRVQSQSHRSSRSSR